MSAKKNKILKSKANGLPVVMEFHMAWVKGSVLLEQGQKTTAEGKEINPDEDYFAQQPKAVDHLTKIKTTYNKFGMAAVDEYCAYVKNVAGVTSDNSEYVFPEWFNTDNVHEVGNNKIHYTEDGDKPLRDDHELSTAIMKHTKTNCSVTDMVFDDVPFVRLYILQITS